MGTLGLVTITTLGIGIIVLFIECLDNRIKIKLLRRELYSNSDRIENLENEVYKVKD